MSDIATRYKIKMLSNALDIYIYEDICAKKFNWATFEEIDSETSAKHIAKLIDEAGDIQNINLYINSFGGEVDQALAIYNSLKRCQAEITVYIDGYACSAASLIAMAGDLIIMGTGSMMMLHNPWMAVAGNATELRQAADTLDKIKDNMKEAYLQKSGKLSEEKLNEMLEAETWLSAEECLSFGLCDEVGAMKKKNNPEEDDEQKKEAKAQYSLFLKMSAAAKSAQKKSIFNKFKNKK